MSICVCTNAHLRNEVAAISRKKKRRLFVSQMQIISLSETIGELPFGVTLIFPSTSSTYILYILYIFSLFLIIALQLIFIRQYYTNNIPMYQVEWL